MSTVAPIASTIQGVPSHRQPQFATRRRAGLFDELDALFLQEGFADLTLDDNATRLRCSKSTLYALAGSKEQLVQAVMVHFFKRATDAVEHRIELVSGARQRITAYLLAVGDELADAYLIASWLISMRSRPRGRCTNAIPRSLPAGCRH